ncbi:phage portal protein [Jeotgalibaca porci]|uniref:phage portal protein n=1 Tax=Jeotgalibaca porci TaxID=1868793 RepID=UPI0035A1668A
MDNPKFFQSENPQTLALAVKRAITSDRGATHKHKMRTGVDYYKFKHDILNYRLFYVDNEGKMKEETNRSNIKIAHPYLTELIDQKVQYLLAKPLEVKTEQKGLQDYLKEYLDEDFQMMLQETLEGASQKGHEFVFVKYDDRLTFKPADSLKVIEIYNTDGQLVAVINYYETEILIDEKMTKVLRAELWDKEKVWYFITKDSHSQVLEVDDTVPVNPIYHDTYLNEESKEAIGQSLGRIISVDDFIPFIRFDNNKYRTTDLEPIKDLIDDYDLMAVSLSNNLQDFDQPFFAVKGFNGTDYDALINNVRSRGVVGTDTDGGLDVHTVEIPVEARKEKLRIDKEGIYKFGQGFDSSQVGDGNVTNIVIQSRYTALDLKANKTEIRLRRLVKQLLELIIADINKRFNKSYTTDDLEIIISRSMLVNDKEKATSESQRATAKQTLVTALTLAAPYLPSEVITEEICKMWEIDFEEVMKKIEHEDFGTLEDGEEDEVEPMAT